PETVSVDFDAVERRTYHLETASDVAQCEAGPPVEVTDCCRTMTAEIAQCQFREGFVAVEPPRLRRAVLEQGICVLLAVRRATANHASQLRVHQHVGERHSLHADPGLLQQRLNTLARELSPFGRL